MGDELRVLRDIKYSIDKTNFIRQALAGYVGGNAIATELVQNADDGEATCISFHFGPERLRVRNNGVFSERDFENITEIAKGGRRHEQNKTGMWGTGFLSVFHLTDAPELLSAGQHIIFDPQQDSLPVYETDVRETEFRLPWRRTDTALSQRLDTTPWPDDRIAQLKEDLAAMIYRLILFLRRVRQIEVYDGDAGDRLLYRVERNLVEAVDRGAFRRETWSIEYKQRGQPTRTDLWVYHVAEVPAAQAPAGVTVKDFCISMAFALEEREWLTKNVPGTLYNCLPTPIETQFGLQLNGPFFPDSSRRSILLDQTTQPARSIWNQRVVAALANLVVNAIPDIREQTKTPARFYDLLPVAPPPQEFLQIVHTRFTNEAKKIRLVFTTQETWEHPQNVLLGLPGSRLPTLAASYLPVVPNGTPQPFREFLSRTIKSASLSWNHVIEYLASHVQAGQPLAETHPMINSREKLNVLYDSLPVNLLPTEAASLKPAAIFLAEDGALYPANAVRRGDQAVRYLASNANVRFLDQKVQDNYVGLCRAVVPEFLGAELIRFMASLEWPETPFPFDSAPPIIGDQRKAEKVLRFIAQDLVNVNAPLLASLPVILSSDKLLVSNGDGVFIAGPEAQETLAGLGLHFVESRWARDNDIESVLTKAGVSELQPRHVISHLQRCVSAWQDLAHAGLVHRLLSVYGYFVREAKALTPADRGDLSRLPICLTQGGRLAPAHGRDGQQLYLSAERAQDRALVHLNRLELDNLIHSELVSGDGERFLRSVLAVATLSPTELIRLVVQHYLDQRLSDDQRRDLLSYVGDQMRKLSDEQQRTLWPSLQGARLVQCEDGEYRTAEKVYFASSELDVVFPGGYRRCHPGYKIPVALPDDQDQASYRKSGWYWLFDNLGMNEHAAPADLVEAVEQIVSGGPPSDDHVERIRRIYDLLNREITSKGYTSSPFLRRLAGLRWLPARGDDLAWHQPSELYQASLIDLIGEQEPMLRFGETSKALREFLNMPAYVPPDVVARHLLASGRQQKGVDPRVYGDLGRRWSDISDQLQARLRAERVVWDMRDNYWLASEVFFEDQTHLFGARRCYLRPPGDAAQTFLEKVGVRQRPDPWGDSLTLIEEIAAQYRDSSDLSAEDRALLLANFDHLGRLCQTEGGLPAARSERLARWSFVPDERGRLHRSQRILIADQREMREKFDDTAFAVVGEQGLTEQGYLFLSQMRVPRLSGLIRRKPAEVIGPQPDDDLSYRLRALTGAFQRIALTLRDQYGKQFVPELPADKLKSVQIYRCERIKVAYSLDDGRGWRVDGRILPEPTLYDVSRNSLFVSSNDQSHLPLVPLALELQAWLFPGAKESVLIEQLLYRRAADLDRYLDEHGYRREFQSAPMQTTSEGGDDLMAEWQGANEMPRPDPPIEAEPSVNEATAIGTGGEGELIGVVPDFQETLPFLNIADPWPAQSGTTDGHLDGPGSSKSTTGSAAGSPQTTDGEASLPAVAGEDFSQGSDGAEYMFRGRQLPDVPFLRNNYDQLVKEFGLPCENPDTSFSIVSADGVESDGNWTNEDEQAETETEYDYVNQVRFTLTFMNRYEGFLPLHRQARAMLKDCPNRLHCTTDYEDWQFDLYVDRAAGVIHNREMLPKFLEAYNIPAGGIVYLQRIPGPALKLFWKSSAGSIANVRGLELLEDGTLNEYDIPALEVPCEVAEYVLRAEKRLEDTAALFTQALGKQGLFQTMCEAFGEPGAELSYREIFDRVAQQRCVAHMSIEQELQRRPCFVRVSDDQWRFEPGWGLHPALMRKATTSQLEDERGRGTVPAPDRSVPGSLQMRTEGPADGFAELVSQLQQTLASIAQQLADTSVEPRVHISQIAAQLTELGQRLTSDLQTFAQPSSLADDPTLRGLWGELLREPQNAQRRAALRRYVVRGLTGQGGDQRMDQIKRLVAGTPPRARELVIYPALVDVAKACSQQFESAHVAERLYEFLTEQRAGNFDTELAQLACRNIVEDHIRVARAVEDPDERWAWWDDGWRECTGNPALASAIQEDCDGAVERATQEVSKATERGEVLAAQSMYEAWLSRLAPLADVWSHSQAALNLWNLALRLFDAFVGAAANAKDDVVLYKRALAVIANVPNDYLNRLPIDEYLGAAVEVAEALERESDHDAAIALLAYMVHLADLEKLKPDPYVLYRLHEYLSRLYEYRQFYALAYDHLARAQRFQKTEDKKRSLSARLHQLANSRQDKEAAGERREWSEEAVTLVEKNLRSLVNIHTFRKVISDR